MASKAVLRAIKSLEHEQSIGIGAKAKERQVRGVKRGASTRAVNKLFKGVA